VFCSVSLCSELRGSTPAHSRVVFQPLPRSKRWRRLPTPVRIGHRLQVQEPTICGWLSVSGVRVGCWPSAGGDGGGQGHGARGTAGVEGVEGVEGMAGVKGKAGVEGREA
jgi:hypothetical protein